MDALERQLRGCIDLFAYRLDAWITSLATRRLGELRAKAPQRARARRVRLGAGPEGLAARDGARAARRDGRALRGARAGRLPARAVAGAGLGRGRARAAATSRTWARPARASSRSTSPRRACAWPSRCSTACARGSSSARCSATASSARLHERQLDRFIAGFRRISLLGRVYQAKQDLDLLLGGIGFPPPKQVKALQDALDAELNAVRNRLGTAPDATIAELEPVAAASLTDGFALVQQLHGRGVRFEQLGVPLGGDRPKLEAELAALDEAVDALGDALTAEGVFQLVRGNPARAAASVDAIAHGEIQPPELHFARDAAARDGADAPARRAVQRARARAGRRASRAARRAAEPKLDAWLAQMVGAPKSVRLRAEFVDDAGKVARGARTCASSVLGVSSLDALLPLARRPRRSCPPTSSGCSSTCSCAARPQRSRRPRACGSTARAAPASRAADLSLGEFLELNAAFRQAVLSARTLDAPDFHEDGGAIASAADGAELGKRADRAVATLKAARDALDAADRRGRAPSRSATRSSTSSSSASPRRCPASARRRRRRRSSRRRARSRRRRPAASRRSTRSRPASTRRP